MKRMDKRWAAVLVVLCAVMLCLGARAEAYDDLTLACRYVRESVYTDRDGEVAFTLTSRAADGRELPQIRDILTDVLEGCSDYDIYFTPDSGTVDVRITYTLRPALKILEAYQTGDTSPLTEAEKQCMAIALDAVRACWAQSDNVLELERALYDYVCARVVYNDGPGIGSFGTEEYIRNSTAVGALVDGKTLCLGYAEAFYLLGQLAGLDVEMQYGFADDRGTGKHAWNTVRIAGNTYMVDVCWGDTDADGFELTTPHYGYFNLGEDWMPQGRHSHPEAEIVRINAQTSPEHTAFGVAGGGRICNSLQEAVTYAVARCRQGESYAHAFIPRMQIGLDQVDPLMWEEMKRSGLQLTWGRLTYDFAGGTYIIFRFVHE